jgi:hypothetical protein
MNKKAKAMPQMITKRVIKSAGKHWQNGISLLPRCPIQA